MVNRNLPVELGSGVTPSTSTTSEPSSTTTFANLTRAPEDIEEATMDPATVALIV